MSEKAIKAFAQRLATLEQAVHALQETPKQTLPADSSAACGDNSSQTPSSSRAPWWRRIWVWKPWKRGLGTIVGVAAVAYSLITYGQWVDARKNFTLDERAWLKINVLTPISDANTTIKDFKDLRCPFEIVNVGKTAALHVSLVTSAEIVHRHDTPSLGYPDHAIQGGTTGMLFPGESLKSNGGSLAVVIDSERIALNEGEAYVVYYGKLVYQDIFGKSHETRACAWSSAVNAGGSFSARPCTDYNYTDAK